MGHFVDDRGGLVDLEEREIRSAADVEQDAACAIDRRLEQRRTDRLTSGRDGTSLTRRVTHTQERGTGIVHDHLHVGEIGVDQSWGRDEIGDALNALQQDLVGHLERVQHRGLVVRHRQQPVIRDDDLGVDLFLELADALIRLDRTPPTLEQERAGDHRDRERADRLGDLGDDRSAPGTGTTAFACSDEDHVGASQHLLDLRTVVFGGLSSDLGVGSGAKTAGYLTADVELHIRVAHQQRLGVGVDGDELNALQPGVDHSVHGVATTATDSDHLDDGEIVLRIVSHVSGDLRSHPVGERRWRVDGDDIAEQTPKCGRPEVTC